jgi:porin
MNRTTTHLTCLLLGIILTSSHTVATPVQTEQPDVQAPTQSSTAPTASQPATIDGVVLPTTTTATPTAPAGLTTTGEPGFLDQNLMTGNWGGFRDTLADDGVKFSPTWIGEVFGNPSGGMKQGVISDGLFNLPLDLDLERMSDGGVDGLTIHANALYIYGPSLSEFYTGDFSNTSNIAGYNTLRLQELWLQKWFWQQRLSIKAGNIAVDSEFFQSSSASLFINGTFGAFTFIGSNVPNAPVYPAASPGVRIQFLPTSNFYAMAGVFGMDNNSNLATNNQNGTRFALTASSGMLIMSEAGYLLNQSPNDRGLQGTYRLGSFVHTANYDNWGSQAASALGTGSLQSAGTNYGVYGVMDQQLYTKADEAISLFVRAGGAPSNVNFVDWYVDGGFNFTGFIPGRENDIAGIAVARSHVSSNFSDSQILQGATPYTAETVLEATYKVQIAPWWSVQPDFQYIVTPGGEQGVGIPNAVVVGLRTTVAF